MTAPINPNISFEGGSAASFVATEPASAAQDDILLWSILSGTGVSITYAPAAHGWTEIVTKSGSNGLRFSCYWIRRGASAPDLEISWSAGTDYNSLISRWTGAKTSGSAFGATNLPAAFFTGTTLDSGAVTTTANDSSIITLGFQQNAAPAGGWLPPSGYTGVLTGIFDDWFGCAYKALTGGSGTSQDPGSMGTSGASAEGYVITLELLSDDPSSGGVYVPFSSPYNKLIKAI
jgi:hypothetical protein